MTTIADPITLPNGQTFANRLVKGAMTEGLADAYGRPTAALNRLYERWADGGAGMLLTGNIQLDRHHLERAGNVILDAAPDADMAARLAALARAGQGGGTRIWAQVSHAGRQTPLNINPAPKAPSAVPLKVAPQMKFGDPVAMTAAEIAAVVDRFVAAATALKTAGFDGIQVHAAHGYLLAQFLSPKSNRRDDAWGGSLTNRARLLMAVIERIKPLTDATFGLSVKLNSADFQRGGFDADDSVTVARWLDEAGVDLIEISGGTYEAPRMVGFTEDVGAGAQRATHAREAYFIEFAPRVRAALSRASLMVTGGFRTRSVMDTALSDDGVDLIGIARPLCATPDAAAQLLDGRIAALPRYEDSIRLGPGVLSGNSRFQFFKTLNGLMSQAWYYQNLVRLSEDAALYRPGQLFRAALSYQRRDGALAKAVVAASATASSSPG